MDVLSRLRVVIRLNLARGLFKHDLLLVLRHREDEIFEIIGYTIMSSAYKIARTYSVTPGYPILQGEPVGRFMPGLQLQLHISPEDAVVLYGEDMHPQNISEFDRHREWELTHHDVDKGAVTRPRHDEPDRISEHQLRSVKAVCGRLWTKVTSASVGTAHFE